MDNLGNTCALRKACLSCDGFPMVAAGRRCSGEFHSNGTVGVKGPESESAITSSEGKLFGVKESIQWCAVFGLW